MPQHTLLGRFVHSTPQIFGDEWIIGLRYYQCKPLRCSPLKTLHFMHTHTLGQIDVIDNILKHLDSYKHVLGTYLDLQKAFDTVNHRIPLPYLSVAR